MAKNVGLFGAWTGKLANTVGYLLKNSNNNVTQGVRAYQPIVSNPKSEPQATQRMKMTAALNFYRQLGTILNNAWQGTKYGTESRQKFMSMAMSQITGIPFIDKGDKKFYPGQFPVSQGSIPSQSIQSIASTWAVTSLVVENSIGGDTTWGQFSQELINKNFGIKNGDKLTFIYVVEKDSQYLPVYTYVILNTTNESLASDILSQSNLEFFTPNIDDVKTVCFSIKSLGETYTPVAAAIIVSRYPSAGTTWERSSAVMKCSSAYLAKMMGTQRYSDAAATYMAKSTELSSDWYLNVGVDGKGTVVSGGSGDSNLSIVSQENITVSLDNASGVGSNTSVGILTMSDGTKRAASNNGNVAYVNASSYTATTMPANANNLAKIKAVDSAVSGWQNVTVSSGDPNEERP